MVDFIVPGIMAVGIHLGIMVDGIALGIMAGGIALGTVGIMVTTTDTIMDSMMATTLTIRTTVQEEALVLTGQVI
jgi:hypothetical protein